MGKEHNAESNTNHFFYGFITSFCAPAIIFVSATLLKINAELPFYILIYLLPLTVYVYDHFFGRSKNNYLFVLPILASGVVMFYYPGNIYFSLLYYAVIIVCLLYPVAIKKATQKIPFFKDFFVALVWALLVPILCVRYGVPLNITFFLMFLLVFVRTFVDASYCDIKDYENDKAAGIKTAAAKIGIDNTVAMLQAINAVSLLGIVYTWVDGLFSADVLWIALAVLINAICIGFFSKRYNYSIYLADSEYLFWLLPLVITRLLWK